MEILGQKYTSDEAGGIAGALAEAQNAWSKQSSRNNLFWFLAFRCAGMVINGQGGPVLLDAAIEDLRGCIRKQGKK